ncbi:MAG: permease-like cell division protein FtsX [Thermodesulfobacteriota bacterium]
MSSSLKFYYSTQDAYTNIKANLLTTVLSAFTVGISLAIFALFSIIFFNLNAVAEKWGDRTHVVAYLTADSSKVEIGKLKAAILGVAGVREIKYVSSKKAMEKLKGDLKGHEVIFEGVSPDLLPSSFEIRVTEEYLRGGRVTEIARGLKRIKWVSEVQYGQEWMEKLTAFLRFFEFTAIFVGVFLAAAVLFIISNTIRLTVYVRRDEIVILRLIGASDPYIKIPFFLEGVFMGLIGGLLAVGMLVLARNLFMSKVPQYLSFMAENPFGTPALIAMLIISGIILGVAGSLFSLEKFLKV